MSYKLVTQVWRSDPHSPSTALRVIGPPPPPPWGPGGQGGEGGIECGGDTSGYYTKSQKTYKALEGTCSFERLKDLEVVPHPQNVILDKKSK